MSVNRGNTVNFKIKAPIGTPYQIDIYRLGWYGGDGARFVTTLGPFNGTGQPSCLYQATSGLVDCGNWSVSASWSVPADAISGVYIARLMRLDTLGASHI